MIFPARIGPVQWSDPFEERPMSEPEILPAPVLDLGPKTKWERERQAFYRLLPDLPFQTSSHSRVL